MLPAAVQITDYTLRMADHKRQAVCAFRLLHYTTLATGESFPPACLPRARARASTCTFPVLCLTLCFGCARG